MTASPEVQVEETPFNRRPHESLSAASVAAFDEYVRLPLQEALEVWKTLPAPEFEEMDGEFTGHLTGWVNEEQKQRSMDFLGHLGAQHGLWTAKAFIPRGQVSGDGYNVFLHPDGSTKRWIRYGTVIGCSHIDGRLSLLMTYSSFNRTGSSPQVPGEPAWSRDTLDEMRKLADGVYAGFATAKLEFSLRPGNDVSRRIQENSGPLPQEVTATTRTNPLPAQFVLTGPCGSAPGVDDPAVEDR
jgi:hypothetical protein